MSLLSKLTLPETVSYPTFITLSFPYQLLLLTHQQESNNCENVEDLIQLKYHFTTNQVKSLMEIVNEHFNFTKMEKLKQTVYDDSAHSNMKKQIWYKKAIGNEFTKFSCKSINHNQQNDKDCGKVIISQNVKQMMIIHNESSAGIDYDKEQGLMPVIEFINYKSTYSHKTNKRIKFTYDTVLFEEIRFVVFSIIGLVPKSFIVEGAIVGNDDMDMKNKFNGLEACCRNKVCEILYRRRNKFNNVYDSLLRNNLVWNDEYYLSQDYEFEPIEGKPESDDEFQARLNKIRKLQDAFTEADYDWE